MEHKAELVLNFSSDEHALIAMRCLAVDEELQPNRINKSLTVSGNSLYLLNISASDMKMIRVSLSSFLDMALVVVKSLQEFSSDSSSSSNGSSSGNSNNNNSVC